MMISFTKNLEGSTINDSTVSVQDPFGLPLPVLISLEQANIIVVYPTEDLEAESLYTLTVSKDISDIDGLLLGEDITWSFKTGTAKDHTPPRVIATTPHCGDIAPLSLSRVSVAFSEALALSSVTEENIYLENKDETILPASLSYRADRCEVIINLSSPLQEKQYYTIHAKNIKDLEGNSMAEPWSGKFSTGIIQETETGIPCPRAEGYFGSSHNEEGRILRLSDGTSLIDSPDLTWGDSIAHLMDHNTEGPLAEGTCLRLVVNGKNIAAPEGMKLNPVLKKLTATETPPPGICYIDPLLGRFVLPRPLLYSAMDSLSEVYSPRIKPPGLNVEVECPECMTIESDGGRVYVKLENYAKASKNNKHVESTSGISYDLGADAPEEVIAVFSTFQSVESKILTSDTTNMITDFFIYDITLRSDRVNRDSLFSSYGQIISLNIEKSLEMKGLSFAQGLPEVFLENGTSRLQWSHIYLNDGSSLTTTKFSDKNILYQSTDNHIKKSLSFKNNALSNYSQLGVLLGLDITSTLLIDNLKVWYYEDAITSEWLDAAEKNYPEALHPLYGEEFQYRPVDVRADYYYLP